MIIIAGKYKGRKLSMPKGSQTRPTSSRLREALFNICQHVIEGASFIDIFAGSGAMGFEALSRGAKSVTFIDSHIHAIQAIKQNATQLGVESQCQIMKGDFLSILSLLERKKALYDIIYADPPYFTGTHEQVEGLSTKLIRWIDTHQLLKAGGTLFIEENFHYQPQLNDFTTLSLQDSRKMGPAVLQQYIVD
ncbi:MAG: 16S rRNA (guanine(966)-N(2))-methyltransferase RsmD [Parachlamydiaceae bacterium]|nr:16S rRNA (guanine(966)-N(2))-methyltransferase RsmD [Parachlamydiaceae bacterium]